MQCRRACCSRGVIVSRAARPRAGRGGAPHGWPCGLPVPAAPPELFPVHVEQWHNMTAWGGWREKLGPQACRLRMLMFTPIPAAVACCSRTLPLHFVSWTKEAVELQPSSERKASVRVDLRLVNWSSDPSKDRCIFLLVTLPPSMILRRSLPTVRVWHCAAASCALRAVLQH